MDQVKYLIVGGGMTAAAAVEGIRDVDPKGSIAIIGSETHRPYDRPPLSKGLWKGKTLESIERDLGDGAALQLHLGRTVQAIEPGAHRVTDDQGTIYAYERLLLATGAAPRQLPFGDDHIIYFRTLDDYQRLRALADKGKKFAVIGGGFIGSEIAAALALNGKAVTMAFPEEAIGARVFPEGLAGSLNDYYREKGVEVLNGAKVVGLEPRGDQFTLAIEGGASGASGERTVDGVVAGIGVMPNVELASAAGLEVDDGIVVGPSLATSRPDIFAAGDVARFDNPALGTRIRVEHEDNANTMGRMAGQSMAGKTVVYDHLPSFYSDLFDLGYEAVGELDSRLETVADWKTPNREGVVYYLRDGRVRGVLLWNVWDRVDAARALIAQPGPFRAEDLKGKITG